MTSLGGFYGPATIEYEISDGKGPIIRDTTDVFVNPNTVPAIHVVRHLAGIGQRTRDNLVATLRISDFDGDAVTVDVAQHAAVTTRLAGNDLIVSTVGEATGEVRLVVAGSDPWGGSSTAEVVFDITRVNRLPMPFAFTESPEDPLVASNVPRFIRWSTSTDEDGDPLTYRVRLQGGVLDTVFTTQATGVEFNTAVLRSHTQYLISGAVSDGMDTVSASNTRSFWTAALTGAEAPDRIPTAFAVRQNAPNPFNHETTIRYDLPTAAVVTIDVYDLLGRRVKSAVPDLQEPGVHEYSIDASALANGLYVYRVAAMAMGRVSASSRMMAVAR